MIELTTPRFGRQYFLGWLYSPEYGFVIGKTNGTDIGKSSLCSST